MPIEYDEDEDRDKDKDEKHDQISQVSELNIFNSFREPKEQFKFKVK